ncbi:MAG: prepilin-type N-terminal cleavage/methylation domain-containing protein [Clostridiales Family XIII bacterium]|jgi:type IV pilus assembly protein PilA|nr:prepilin-type N-terminal cleavage/methylation domain-containing protein [Clostridiales Family XIII bacterium]
MDLNIIMKKMVSDAMTCRLRARKGFTLVEVIVVLVILAILAAIAVPALTGYIDKAADKGYISEARNAAVAVRAALNEAYADGEIASSGSEKYFNGDKLFNRSPDADHFDLYEIGDRLSYERSDLMEVFRRAAALTGEPYPDHPNDESSWALLPVAAPDSGATATTADGFTYILYPKGQSASFDAVVAVTYKLDPMIADSWIYWCSLWGSDSVYNPEAGYEVYKFG